MSNLTVATTILQQLGGNKFIAMTGSYNFVGSENDLSMKLRRNKLGASHLTITLMPSDTYVMKFVRVRQFKQTVLAELDYVYCDQLQELFTKYTGLYTSLA